MSTPHDSLFKAVFSQPEHARGALLAVLPAAVGAALDWETLALCPGSFVDPELNERHTDLLYSAAWRGGGDALVYVLFEHQSSPDDRMAFRLLRYLVRIWERWSVDHARARMLPAIVPIVLYHGREPWSAALAFDMMVDVPAEVRAAIAPYLVQFSYVVDDLTEIPDEQLRARAMMTALGRLVEACFKHARTRADLLEILSRWAGVLRDVIRAPHGLDALALVMRYILEVNDQVEPATLRALLERVAGPEAKDAIMTAGERIRQEGVQEGRQEGRQEGVRALLLHLLQKRFGAQVDAGVEQRLAAATSTQIEVWADRVLSAVTLGELLAD